MKFIMKQEETPNDSVWVKLNPEKMYYIDSDSMDISTVKPEHLYVIAKFCICTSFHVLPYIDHVENGEYFIRDYIKLRDNSLSIEKLDLIVTNDENEYNTLAVGGVELDSSLIEYKTTDPNIELFIYDKALVDSQEIVEDSNA